MGLNRAEPFALVLAVALAAVGCRADSSTKGGAGERPQLALMSSLPIYWGENAEFGAVLTENAEPGWVRQTLEARYRLEPLDTLDEQALSAARMLLLAQPRPLTPTENAALDRWVRQGGRLLLFADPLLTAHSRYPIGDQRRAQDVALLSPILGHWGLELTLEDDANASAQTVTLSGTTLPVEVPGKFRVLPGGQCTLAGDGLLASCTIGRGRVVALADAALLDDAEGSPDRTIVLAGLLRRAFD